MINTFSLCSRFCCGGSRFFGSGLYLSFAAAVFVAVISFCPTKLFAEGSEVPAEGSEVPAEGSEVPAEGSGVPAKGSGSEDPAGDPNPAYGAVDIRSGVYNDGQASFWDLHILDHYRYLGPEERVRGYRPEQPIKFSHVTHVQKNQMDCQFCHWSVAKAAYAAIPEVQTCMGCHSLIKGSTEEKQTEIAKVEKAWNENKPIEWVKVHVMPSHVHFNHKRHVKAGVTCQSCHGQVPKMEVVERVSTMRMGWCVDCHRQKGASIDCYTCHF